MYLMRVEMEGSEKLSLSAACAVSRVLVSSHALHIDTVLIAKMTP